MYAMGLSTLRNLRRAATARRKVSCTTSAARSEPRGQVGVQPIGAGVVQLRKRGFIPARQSSRQFVHADVRRKLSITKTLLTLIFIQKLGMTPNFLANRDEKPIGRPAVAGGSGLDEAIGEAAGPKNSPRPGVEFLAESGKMLDSPLAIGWHKIEAASRRFGIRGKTPRLRF